MQDNIQVGLFGLGASGVFALEELAQFLANYTVHAYDVGLPYAKRYACPISQGKLVECPPDVCNYCAPGQSGGSFTDYKFCATASPVIGGRLWDVIGQSELQRRLDANRRTLLNHAEEEIPIVSPNRDDLEWINGKAAAAGMVYHHQELLHFGSDRAPKINTNILESIKRSGDNMEFHWNTRVLSLSRHGEQFLVKYNKYRTASKEEPNPEQEAVFDIVIVSAGRGGANWLTRQEFYPALGPQPGQLDIGVRVETRASVTAHLDERYYEPKLYFNSTKGHVVRNFCSNREGFVAIENHRGYILVNGHSERDKKSPNSNFAVLVRQTRENPQEYAQKVARDVNALAGGKPMVQRLGDLRAGRPTESLEGNWIQPTIQAVCGNLAQGYPEGMLESIVEYMLALEQICPGITHDDTLVYGPECKTYADWFPLDRGMQTNIPNAYVIGDLGASRGVAQASVTGSAAGEAIRRKIESWATRRAEIQQLTA